jgi:hypothetical protein
MKTRAIVAVFALLIPVALTALGASATLAQTDVTVDPSEINLGFMNVFNLPAPDGDGTFQFASEWGLPDLTATYSGSILTLGPNTIGDPDPYWYIGGGGPGAAGNKIMEANTYGEANGGLSGETVTFSGSVLANTLTPAHTVTAFIRDFAPDFSSFVETVVPLNAPGPFSINLATIADPARHVQWGFQMVGVNVWVTDVAPFGTMVIGPDGTVGTESASFGEVKSLYR